MPYEIYKNPNCKKIRGSHILAVSCAHCKTFIANYQKVGESNFVKIDLVYDKLFFGNNLPSLKLKDAEDYVPIWNKEQIAIIKSVMADGLSIWSGHQVQ